MYGYELGRYPIAKRLPKAICVQRGVATLAISLIILFLITIVTLYTAKTSVMEQKISANQYRAEQAFAAASAALEYGIAYFDDGGVSHPDQNGNADELADYAPNSRFDLEIRSVNDELVTTGEMFFCHVDDVNLPDNPRGCEAAPVQGETAVIVATGWSDDLTSEHTIVVTVTNDNVASQGISVPLISKGAIGLTGATSIINRYSQETVWSGDTTKMGSSNAAATYTLDPADAQGLSREQLTDVNPDHNAEPTSGRDWGNNADVIDNDPYLEEATDDDFFRMFLSGGPEAVKIAAQNIDQYFDNDDTTPWPPLPNSGLDGLEGVVWVDDSLQITGGDIGTLNSPAVVVVDGDVSVSGNPNINGILYVTGDLNVTGTLDARGVVIVQGENVSGNGTLNIVFDRDLFTAGTPKGLTGVVPGSWRDW